MIKYIYGVFLTLILFSCGATNFDDPTTLTNEEAIEQIKYLGYSLTTSSIQNTFNTTTSTSGVHFSLLADQTTNTNMNSAWWNFADEPRLRLTNNSTYRGTIAWTVFYSNFYQANLDATKTIDIIENKKQRVYDKSGKDRTTDCLVAAYYSKGVSQGYLGVIFDRGIIVDNVNITTKGFPNSYKELIQNGVSLIDKSLAIADTAKSLTFDFLTGTTINKSDFIKLGNSMAARILSSLPRDKSEAITVGNALWNKVLAYANKGFTTDFTITTVSGGYYNQLLSYLVQRNSDGSGYLPPDIKIPYLADNTGQTPNYYPSSGILPAITSNDKRFYKYFGYTTSFGIFMESRGRGLFTNYYRVRWYNTKNTLNVAGAVNPYFLAEETRLLRAESKLWLGDYTGAAAELNDASAARKLIGNLPDVAANETAVRNALHYEYAIEIDGAGGAFVPFTFMRRNNLLIGGTPTEFPIPQVQLDLVGETVYTFGGKAYLGEKGKYGETATAVDAGWKLSK
ncbi:MAG: hypothetical protein Q8861_00760 [Bacteroidota bacterium]|nr:hypothetical protein [Bacteroidota bacterium]